jgi:membrane-associated phospholipid phosphatase
VLAFTRSGEHGVLWLLVGVAGAIAHARERDRYVRAVRVVILAYLGNIALKHVVRRARPLLEELPALSPTVTQLSYPSAHSTTSFAAAAALRGALPAPPLYTVAGAMALSRVYAGVHYPTDVAAGAVLGTALGELIP